MNRPVVLTPAAEQDVARAQDDYEAREQGLGNRFVEQVRTTLTRIGHNPFQYQIVPDAFGSHRAPAGGELPIVPQPRLNRRVIAVIQPVQIRILADVSLRDKDARSVRSVDNSRGTDLPRAGVVHAVIPRSASDTAHDSGAASDTY